MQGSYMNVKYSFSMEEIRYFQYFDTKQNPHIIYAAVPGGMNITFLIKSMCVWHASTQCWHWIGVQVRPLDIKFNIPMQKCGRAKQT